MDSPARIKAIARFFSDKVKQANFGGVILDNLEASDEQLVLSILDELGWERTIVAFLIARDNEFGKSATSAAFYSAEFDLDFLNAEQAISFVKSRLCEFRKTVKDIPAWMQQDEWALFPFRRDDIETAVDLGVLGGTPERKAQPTIRNLGSILKGALEEEVQRFRHDGAQDIRAVDPTSIEKRVINLLRYVAQLTTRMIRKNGKKKAA
jgi:hypothetical protein